MEQHPIAMWLFGETCNLMEHIFVQFLFAGTLESGYLVGTNSLESC